MKNFKQQTLSLIIAIITIFNLTAQNNPNTNLWKVEGDSIKTSYLFGTIHILPKKDFKLSDRVKKAFDSCNKIALEIDMGDPNFAKEAMRLSQLKEGENLSQYMDEDEYKLLDNFLKENLKMGLDLFNKFKPITLMSIIMMAKYKDEPFASYEMSFIEMSKAVNKEMEGLETFEDQMKAIDSQPYDEQIDTYIEMIEDSEETDKEYKNLLNLYLAENVDGLYNIMLEIMDGDAELLKKILDDRNNKWIPKFAEYSKEKSVFYAVGAAHLGGDQGVISLLKKAGYKLTPILD